ncbi:hypothetical protein LZ32DRAFT_610258 [Colletotrichum eremochloae]|nr:hypothetical protein LZ32DRAFT_610258 [Colletotrichum eremochloae]
MSESVVLAYLSPYLGWAMTKPLPSVFRSYRTSYKGGYTATTRIPPSPVISWGSRNAYIRLFGSGAPHRDGWRKSALLAD